MFGINQVLFVFLRIKYFVYFLPALLAIFVLIFLYRLDTF